MNDDAGLRSPKNDDLEVCVRLLSTAGLPVADVSIDRIALLAEQDGVVAGLIGLEQFESIGLLRSLVVDPASRRAGLGKTLVRALEQRATSLGIETLWLLTIDKDAYFESLGYRRQARSSAPTPITMTDEFSGLCPDNAILMSKQLRA